eukprot:2364461-Rhodomonas_salina.1
MVQTPAGTNPRRRRLYQRPRAAQHTHGTTPRGTKQRTIRAVCTGQRIGPYASPGAATVLSSRIGLCEVRY